MGVLNRDDSVQLVSEDRDELLELASRILVMFGGRTVYETRRSKAVATVIGRHMAGLGKEISWTS